MGYSAGIQKCPESFEHATSASDVESWVSDEAQRMSRDLV